MQRDAFDAYCGSLKATTHVVQWGGSSVWKVGGRIFAICSHWGPGSHDRISFKCSDLGYRILCDQEGIVPAPYLARAKWVQIEEPGAMNEEELKRYIETAYVIVMAKLTKTQRAELGLELPQRL